MRGMVAGLMVALLVTVVTLLGAAVAAFGVAGIGWILRLAFGLTLWQGTLVALASTCFLGVVVYKLAVKPSLSESTAPDWTGWSVEQSAGALELAERLSAAERHAVAELAQDPAGCDQEPSIPAWRLRRPTQGELPVRRVGAEEQRRR